LQELHGFGIFGRNSYKMRKFLFIVFLFLVGFSYTQTGTLTDSRDGKVYKTVIIGNQTWLAENINVTHFRNGDPIMKAESIEDYQKSILMGIPAWMDWGPEINVDTTILKYKPSKLYNWHAVNDTRGLGPEGFHVPSIEEWKLLDSTIGFESAKKLKSKDFWDCYLEIPNYCFRCKSNKMKTQGTYEEVIGVICDKCGNPCERIQKSGKGYDTFGFNLLPDGCFDDWFDTPFWRGGLNLEARFWASKSDSVVLIETYDDNIKFEVLNGEPQAHFLEEFPYFSLRLVKDNLLPKEVIKDELIFNEITTESKVKIGDQTWMSKNLNVSTFRNGDSIQEAKTPEEWRKAIDNKKPAWCYYNNDPTNGQNYGKLYNWFAINDSRGLAPEGWRIPNKVDLEVFHTFLGEDYAPKIRSKKAWKNFTLEFNNQDCNCDSLRITFRSCDFGSGLGFKYLSKKDCSSCNGQGIISTKIDTNYVLHNDDFGFCALPGGFRSYNGIFYSIGTDGYWWLSDKSQIDSDLFSELNSELIDVHFLANKFSIYLDGDDFLVGESIYTNGYSVRCIEGEKITESTNRIINDVKISQNPRQIDYKSQHEVVDKNNIPKDIDGNIYRTVALGGNIWSSENLNVSRFRNGDIIPQAKTHEELETMGKNGQPAWCYYNFSESTDLQVERFGKMYNWYAVIDPRGLTPEGWHIPNNQEWEELDRGIYISYNNSSFKLSNMWIEAARMTPVIEKKWINVEEGGYYEENWVECSNCEYWTDKQKENNPCTVCKNKRGKYIKGKYVPKKNVKTEIEFDYGWDGTNVSGFSALRVASEWWCSDVNTQHFNKPPFGYSVRSGYCYLYKDFHYKYEARFVRFVKN
jgi:uncharacterized protein (TIGR02145 family)